MTKLLEAYRVLNTQGVDVLAELYGLSKWQIMNYGFTPAQAQEWLKTAEMLYGPTRYTRKQALTVQAARDNKHSPDTLAMINRHARGLDNPTAAWDLRVELSQRAESFHDLNKYARQRVKQLREQQQNTDPDAVAADGSSAVPRLRTSYQPEALQSTLHFTDDEHRVAEIKTRLTELGGSEDPVLMARTLRDVVLGHIPNGAVAFGSAGSATDRSAGQGESADARLGEPHAGLNQANQSLGQGELVQSPGPGLTTTAIIALDDLDRIIRCDEGAGDILIARSDGSRMTGKQYAEAKLSETGYVVLVKDMEGPVQAYRTQRLANKKQRVMAIAENPVCPWPDCGKPADQCQIHHLNAFKHGGNTNSSELSTACAYHNGVNDDDPNAPPRRGRLERIDGQIMWKPPGGGPPQQNQHPTAQLGAMRILS